MSEAFSLKKEVTPFELLVRVIDIRYNRNSEILQKKSTLQEYSQFQHILLERYETEKDMGKAIEEAITCSLQRGILTEFLTEHAADIPSLFTLAYEKEFVRKIEQEENGVLQFKTYKMFNVMEATTHSLMEQGHLHCNKKRKQN